MDDLAAIAFDDPLTPTPIYVLVNDYDPNGLPIEVTGVSSSMEGGSVEIDSSGLFVWYTPPNLPDTDISIGGTILAGVIPPEDTGSTAPSTPPDDFAPFTDSFDYTITNSCGETASAFVQVAAPVAGSWTYSMIPPTPTAAQVGVEGNFGYSARLKQVFGPPRGTRLPNQLWQDNRITATYYYINNMNAFKKERVINDQRLDTSNIGGRTRLNVTDTLSTSAPAGQTPLYYNEMIDKTAGFNAAGVVLPVPPLNMQPWRPNAAQAAAVAGMRGPKESITTLYVYVNKTAIEAGKANGTIPLAEYNALVASINGFGLNYATLPPVYEQYQVGALGVWHFP